MIVWGLSLEFDEPKHGDITRLTYSSANDVVTFEYRPPWSSGTWVERDYGFERFKAILKLINRKPKSAKSFRRNV